MDLRLVTKETPRLDFTTVQYFMNFGIKNGLFPYMPRRTPITEEEIDSVWIPSIPKNTTYHVVASGLIIASATVFGDVKSTYYRYASSREPYALAMVVDPTYDKPQKANALVLETLISKNIPFYDTLPVEDKDTIKTYRFFGFAETLISNDIFKGIGLSGSCIRFDRII